MQRVSVQRMRKRRQLPGSQVSRQEQHSVAACESAFEILKPVVHHNFAYVLASVLGKKAYFRQLAAERGKHATQNPGALAPAFLRICQGEVAHADAPETNM